MSRTPAKKHRKPLSVCGELASNPVYARKLIGAGVRAVSVAAKMIPTLRIAIKNKPKLSKKNLPGKFFSRKDNRKKRKKIGRIIYGDVLLSVRTNGQGQRMRRIGGVR